MTTTAPGPVEVIEGPESYIKLTVDTSGPPVLMLHANGDIYVKGRLAANDQEIVDSLREFLAATKPTVASVTEAMAKLTTEERLEVMKSAIEFEERNPGYSSVRQVILKRLVEATLDPDDCVHAPQCGCA
jgi:hypothetical protein